MLGGAKRRYYHRKDILVTHSPDRNEVKETLSPANTLHSELFALAYPMATVKDPREREELYGLYIAAIRRAREAGLDEELITSIIDAEDEAFSASFPELS